jgi:hypothetical protein
MYIRSSFKLSISISTAGVFTTFITFLDGIFKTGTSRKSDSWARSISTYTNDGGFIISSTRNHGNGDEYCGGLDFALWLLEATWSAN